MINAKFLLKVSRPRFWFYTLGPFLVGIVSASTNLPKVATIDTFLLGFYFLFPANLLIYGINDIFDYETDKLNAKKDDYEVLVSPNQQKPLLAKIAVINLPLIALSIIFSPEVLFGILGFLFFSIFYSAKPIRAKAIPILDSVFNILYIFPAIIGYKAVSGFYPPFLAIIGAGFWTMAMHAYSAIPDISADKEANLNTIATFLGSNGTHIFCLILYLASAIIAGNYLGNFAYFLGLIYSVLMIISLAVSKSDKVFSVYRLFPYINLTVGFILFWFIVLTRHTIDS